MKYIPSILQTTDPMWLVSGPSARIGKRYNVSPGLYELETLASPNYTSHHFICQVRSNNSCLCQQVVLRIERRERRQGLLAGKYQQELTNDWLTGSRTRVRLCPGEGGSGTINDIEIQEEEVWSVVFYFLKEKNQMFNTCTWVEAVFKCAEPKCWC